MSKINMIELILCIQMCVCVREREKKKLTYLKFRSEDVCCPDCNLAHTHTRSTESGDCVCVCSKKGKENARSLSSEWNVVVELDRVCVCVWVTTNMWWSFTSSFKSHFWDQRENGRKEDTHTQTNQPTKSNLIKSLKTADQFSSKSIAKTIVVDRVHDLKTLKMRIDTHTCRFR